MDAVTGWLAEYVSTVAVVFALIIAAALALFSFERALYRIYLMARVRTRWFPEGRFVLACTTGDPRWDAYLSETLLPALEDCMVIVPAHELGLAGDFERRLVETFMPDKGYLPGVLVFMPYFERRLITFGDALGAEGEPDERMIDKATDKLFALVDKQRENVRLYI